MLKTRFDLRPNAMLQHRGPSVPFKVVDGRIIVNVNVNGRGRLLSSSTLAATPVVRKNLTGLVSLFRISA